MTTESKKNLSAPCDFIKIIIHQQTLKINSFFSVPSVNLVLPDRQTSFKKRTFVGRQKCVFCWRRERDSNPRVLAHKLISSQPRYDHFDISPYEIFNFIRGRYRLARTTCCPNPLRIPHPKIDKLACQTQGVGIFAVRRNIPIL